MLLTMEGHQTRTVNTARAALLVAPEFKPEVVLLDIGLPEMDGYEVARRLRAQNGTHAMRLVAVTGYGQPADRRRAQAAGFDEHMVKPVEPSLPAGFLCGPFKRGAKTAERGPEACPLVSYTPLCPSRLPAGMSTAGPSAAPSSGITPFAALKHRDFAVFAAARLCTTLSWQILGAAVGWQVWQLTRNPLSLAFVGLVQFLPFVLLVLPAGQIADRTDRRLVLIGAYTRRSSVQRTAAVVHAFRRNAVWPVFVAMTFFGAGRAFWMPTGQAITPNLVPPEAFPSAVAVNCHALSDQA